MNKISKIIAGMTSTALIIILLIICAFSSVYTLTDDYQAVVTTFGKPELVTKTGLNFKIPFIQHVKKVNTTIKGFAIGWETSDESNPTAAAESTMITNDYNFIDIDFYVTYQITNPVKALYASEDPVIILKNVSQNAIRTVVASYGVDSVLTTGKTEIESNIKQMIKEKMDILDIGISLNDITIQDVEPPTDEVLEAFKRVETAKQNKETEINNANKYRNEQIPSAEAKADQIVKDAEAIKQSKINEAEGQVARFNSTYEEYKNYPLITKQRMYYETMENVLPNVKVIINGSKETPIQEFLPLDSFSINNNEGGINNEQ